MPTTFALKDVKAVVLKEKPHFGDEKAYTLLIKNRGVITAILKAQTRKKKQINLNICSLSAVTLQSTRDKYYIEDSIEIESFFGIRSDIEKLSLSEYLCDLSTELCAHKDNSEIFMSLLLNSFYILENDLTPPEALRRSFELRLLSETGYMPNLLGCANCLSFKSPLYYFFPSRGEVYCEPCMASHSFAEQPVLIAHDAFNAMRHIIFSDLKKCYIKPLPKPTEEQLGKAIDEFLACHFEKKSVALEYYKALTKKVR